MRWRVGVYQRVEGQARVGFKELFEVCFEVGPPLLHVLRLGVFVVKLKPTGARKEDWEGVWFVNLKVEAQTMATALALRAPVLVEVVLVGEHGRLDHIQLNAPKQRRVQIEPRCVWWAVAACPRSIGFKRAHFFSLNEEVVQVAQVAEALADDFDVRFVALDGHLH